MFLQDIRQIQGVEPIFFGKNAQANTIFFKKESVIRIIKQGFFETASNYQAAFKIFEEMRLTESKKYETVWFDAEANWQPYKSCYFNPTGGVTMGKDSISPCELMLNMSNCADDFTNSCFAQAIRWKDDGTRDLSELEPIIDDMGIILNRISTAAMVGLKDTLTCGHLYAGFDNVRYQDALVQDVKKKTNFDLMHMGCQGWLSGLMQAGEGTTHLSQTSVVSASRYNAETGQLTGTFTQMYGEIKEKATVKLRNIIAHKTAYFGKQKRMPLVLVDGFTYEGAVDQYNAQCIDSNCKVMRYTMKTLNGADGLPFEALHIDGLPIIPIYEPQSWDLQYTEGYTHFIIIALSGSIQLGASIDVSKDAASVNAKAAISMYKSSDPENPNMKITSFALLGVGVTDTNLMAGGIDHHTKPV